LFEGLPARVSFFNQGTSAHAVFVSATTPPVHSSRPPAAAAAAAAPRASRPSRSAAVLALQAHALAHGRFDAAAAAVVNQLGLLLACERVSLGLYIGGRLRIVAVSGATDVRESHAAVARLAAAMAEALDQRLVVVHPLPSGASPAITLAHQELAQSNAHGAVCTVPVATRHEMLGALLFERRNGFDSATLETAKDAAMFAGPLLAFQQRAADGLGQRVAQALRPGAPKPFARRGLPVWQAVAGSALLAIGAAALWPVTHHVVAPARVEGTVQQVLAAPVDGFVGTASVRPGDSVKAGQVLLTLDARELTLERDKWAAEIAQLDKQYREALSRDEAAPTVIARAKLEAAQSQHALAEQQLERSTLRAPIDGIVLSGDLTQSVGMPLKRGQELITIAPDRAWRVVAEVEEQSVGALRDGQPAHALFAALPGREPLTFKVTRIAPVATQADGRNVFEVEGVPASPPDALRPGMRGVARIEVGEQALGAIWWERAQHAWRRLLWQLSG
jgi:RND family efflux transporter MFP subunit